MKYNMESFMDWYFKLKNGIKNLFNYFKLVWNDRSYDFKYNYKILLFKLEKQRLLLEKEFKKSILSSFCYQYKIKQIKFCENILKRLIEDKYCKTSTERLYNFAEKKELDGCEMLDSIDLIDSTYKTYYLQRERDKKLLYSMLLKYSESWWL